MEEDDVVGNGQQASQCRQERCWRCQRGVQETAKTTRVREETVDKIAVTDSRIKTTAIVVEGEGGKLFDFILVRKGERKEEKIAETAKGSKYHELRLGGFKEGNCWEKTQIFVF